MKYFKTELIEQFREEKGWSIRTFCKECEISILTYIKILNQQLDFKSSALYKIARLMNLKITDICC
jgi:transcriptional regulator with XRE-family HTH domain